MIINQSQWSSIIVQLTDIHCAEFLGKHTKCICILYHDSILKQDVEFILKKDKVPITHSQWHGCYSLMMWGAAYQPWVSFPRGWINIKMSSYQYRKSHCGDETMWRPSYLHNGISCTGKMTYLYGIRALNITVSAPKGLMFAMMLTKNTPYDMDE